MTGRRASIYESIVEGAVREGLEALSHAIGYSLQIVVGKPTADDVVVPPPRISVPSSLNLDPSSLNLSSCSFSATMP